MFTAVAHFVIRRRAVVIGLYAVLVPIALILAGSVLPKDRKFYREVAA